jgi:hypothetical protein
MRFVARCTLHSTDLVPPLIKGGTVIEANGNFIDGLYLAKRVRPVPGNPSPGGVAQLVERVLYHSTRRAVPERSWVQSLLPSTEVEPGFGGMLVPVLQLISPVCKTGTSLFLAGAWQKFP